ncbi:DUF4440 domain-containing protein [Altererythrobacter sp. MF3-039]|uniref:DUF4440 domain-containing protein n=1 Tax=Altererythrobacter sp. MF3-039 TaxID=3252901 RepID=UPI00390C484D
MPDFAATIETHEHHLMRAWMRREQGNMRKLLTRDFTMIIGAQRAQILDRPSFLEASAGRLSCSSYGFREIRINRHGKCAWFAAGVDLEMRLAGKDWSGRFWLTDLWTRSKFRRAWKLAERSLSRSDPDEDVPQSIKELQLWK